MIDITTADLHLTDKEADAYRFGVFAQLEKAAKDSGEFVRIVIAGDISDAKDNHPAELLNKVGLHIKKLASLSCVVSVVILAGNHDYADIPTNSSWKFLNLISKVRFIDEIETIDNTLFLPNTREVLKDWKDIDFSTYHRVYLHQAFIGAKLSEGYSLTSGIDPLMFAGTMALAGDIHIHQQPADCYVSIGAPCRMRYGDSYTPSILKISDDNSFKVIETGLFEKEKVTLYSVEDISKIDKELKTAVFIDSDDATAIESALAVSDVGEIVRVTTLQNRTTIVEEDSNSMLDETLVQQWLRYCAMTDTTDDIRDIGLAIIPTGA